MTTGTLDHASPAATPAPSSGRGIAVWVLVVLTSVLVALGTLAVGVQQVLLDSNRWTATVSPLASNATVQASVADTATSLTLNALDLHGRASSLPAPLQNLAGPMETAIASFVDQQAIRLMQSPQFPQLWIELNQAGHQAVVQLLRGEAPAGDAVRIENGEVQVNAVVLVPAVLERLGQAAPDLLSGQLPPALSSGAVPQQIQQSIVGAIGRQLPADFGYVTVMSADTLESARQAVRVLDSVTWILVVGALVSLVATLALAPDVRLATLRLGLGVAICVLLLTLAGMAAGNVLMAALDGYPLSGATQVALTAVLQSVGQFMLIVLIAGLLVALVAFVVGRRRVQIRST